MLQGLLLIAAMTLVAPPEGKVQSKNGEFIFSHYPPQAKAAGEQGAVRFQARVDARGNVKSCKVTQSSGHERLDRETCELIVDHASFKPTLDEGGKARAAVHDGVVNWRLPGRTPAPVKMALDVKSPDEVVCQRQSRTGSLVAFSRLCLTRREWDQRGEAVRADWNDELRKGWGLCGLPPYPAC